MQRKNPRSGEPYYIVFKGVSNKYLSFFKDDTHSTVLNVWPWHHHRKHTGHPGRVCWLQCMMYRRIYNAYIQYMNIPLSLYTHTYIYILIFRYTYALWDRAIVKQSAPFPCLVGTGTHANDISRGCLPKSTPSSSEHLGFVSESRSNPEQVS